MTAHNDQGAPLALASLGTFLMVRPYLPRIYAVNPNPVDPAPQAAATVELRLFSGDTAEQDLRMWAEALLPVSQSVSGAARRINDQFVDLTVRGVVGDPPALVAYEISVAASQPEAFPPAKGDHQWCPLLDWDDLLTDVVNEWVVQYASPSVAAVSRMTFAMNGVEVR